MNAEVDRKRLYVPGAANLYVTLAPLAYPLIRIALGLILVPHGYAKLFLDDAVNASRNFVNFGWAYPLAWAYFIGALEFFGGILLAVGLFTRIIAAAFVVEMAVICFAVLYPSGRGDGAAWNMRCSWASWPWPSCSVAAGAIRSTTSSAASSDRPETA
jgi:putative oxidoreductase